MLCFTRFLHHVFQYGPEDGRNDYQYSNNNNYNNSGSRTTLYHQGIVNTRPDTQGWKLQRNQAQLSTLDSRALQVSCYGLG